PLTRDRSCRQRQQSAHDHSIPARVFVSSGPSMPRQSRLVQQGIGTAPAKQCYMSAFVDPPFPNLRPECRLLKRRTWLAQRRGWLFHARARFAYVEEGESRYEKYLGHEREKTKWMGCR